MFGGAPQAHVKLRDYVFRADSSVLSLKFPQQILTDVLAAERPNVYSKIGAKVTLQLRWERNILPAKHLAPPERRVLFVARFL